MINFKEYIEEAISIDKIKSLMKNEVTWDYENSLKQFFGDKYRIVIDTLPPDLENISNSDIYSKISNVLNKNGFTISVKDYIIGKTLNTYDKQYYKIGKILKKLSEKGEIDESFLYSFRDDPTRIRSKKPNNVVISKHPYDVLGASTDRHWTSCINLGIGINYKEPHNFEKKSNSDLLTKSIYYPYMVAYLVDPDDKNSKGKQEIRRPLSRILIYPFQSKTEPDLYNWSIGDVQGIQNYDFYEIVKNWVMDLNESMNEEYDGNLKFERIRDAYYDEFEESLVKTWFAPDEILDDFIDNSNNITVEDGFNEHYGPYGLRYDIYGVQLNNFIDEKEILNHYFFNDDLFFNKIIYNIINELMVYSQVSFIFCDIEHVDIYKVFGDGSIKFGKIETNCLSEKLKNWYNIIDEGDEQDLLVEIGPYYNIHIIFDYLKKVDHYYDYYRSPFNEKLHFFIKEMEKFIMDSLVDLGIDTELQNWKELDFDLIMEEQDNILEKIEINYD